ncbi:ABC transporter ATP-binding protein [Raineya orbicola]|jgi:lipopolysaccharide transport system ATP-binding protein|uniref:ABC transporter n=1 Tax=Raineya orbicola TaxID=2016530 RepID=A0A2N3IKJ2_9BACT|nr:ABC transporter ATP-binding protein [Raineya orbicola]PKQ70837.1 ABC transporter [Raineya orbicola]
MSNIVLRVENLWKQYRLGLIGSGTIRDDLARFWAKLQGKEDPTLKIGETNDRNIIEGEYVWALQDINFEVKQGEVLGIIGKNGAGKSTLLKILSKVTSPTKGKIYTKGRVASLLEVGTGFHPELTGRENIFLNGAILGMTKNDIRKKFDEIVEFSGIGKYIDTPVKRYSSGMYVRLAFAVAAHLEPEILIIDEVLAVGDAEFQKKCLGKMKEVSGEGRTVLFVSHNMGAVRNLCSKAIFMEKGKIAFQGETNKVVGRYLQNTNENLSGIFEIGKKTADGTVIIQKTIFKNKEGKITNNLNFGDDLSIELYGYAKERLEKPYFYFDIESQHGFLAGAYSLLDGWRPEYIEGDFVIKCTFKNLRLLPQIFTVWFGMRDKSGGHTLLGYTEVGNFLLTSTPEEMSLKSEIAGSFVEILSPYLMEYQWEKVK